MSFACSVNAAGRYIGVCYSVRGYREYIREYVDLLVGYCISIFFSYLAKFVVITHKLVFFQFAFI